MDVPIELVFKGMPNSEPLESLARDRATELEDIFDHIVSCRIAIEVPHKKSTGDMRSARVRVELSVPNRTFIAESKPADDDYTTNDAYAAVDEAFDKMERQLRDFVDQLSDHRDVRFPTGPNAVVASLDIENRDGYVEMADGREVYFKAKSLDDVTFESLNPGDEVNVVVGSSPGSPRPVARRVSV